MGIIRRARRSNRRDEPKPAAVTAMTTEPPQIVEVDSDVVSCDGGGGALGHPKVWLNLGEDGVVDCPYCDCRFVLRSRVAAPSH